MKVSPHKKRRASTPPTTRFESKTGTVLIDCWPFKTTTNRKWEGNQGNKYTKKHLRAQQLPGLPRGTCIGKEKGCKCGGHNKKI